MAKKLLVTIESDTVTDWDVMNSLLNLGHNVKLEADPSSRLATLLTVAEQQRNALNSVKHDRPSAHSSFIWEQINEALAAYEAYKNTP